MEDKIAKTFVFLSAALIALGGGVFGAWVLFYGLNPNEFPDVGWSRGTVRASFHGESYTVRFAGVTSYAWRLHSPRSLEYPTLHLAWDGISGQGEAEVHPALMQFRSADGTLKWLTNEVLAGWFWGRKLDELNPDEVGALQVLVTRMHQAGRGWLPPPRAHAYRYVFLDETFRHHITGIGFPWPALLWILIWGVLMIKAGRWLWRHC